MNGFSTLLEYREVLLKGAWVTLELSIFGLLVSLAFGLLACLGKMSKNPWLRVPAYTYTTLVRGVPDLIQLFLIYYGGQYLLNALAEKLGWPHLDMNPLGTGIFVIGFVWAPTWPNPSAAASLPSPKDKSKRRAPTASRAKASSGASLGRKCCATPCHHLATTGWY